MVAREILQWPSNTRNVETQREIVKTCLSWTLHIDWMGDSGMLTLTCKRFSALLGMCALFRFLNHQRLTTLICPQLSLGIAYLS